MNVESNKLTTAQLAELATFTGEQLGLNFPIGRLTDLARGVERAAANLHYQNPADFIRRLNQTPPEPYALDMLTSQITIGETYFFRDRACFDALRDQVLPDIIRSRRATGDRRLRIWSAGCCTGEEPYSVAILLDSLIPDVDQWDITLLATDINRTFLNIAKQGIYGDWSFRGQSQDIKEQFFNRRPDGRFELHKHIRDRVTFSYLNLAQNEYPSPANDIHTMDLILCRNVLMYLVPSRARTIVQHLEKTLTDGGWLALSATELTLDLVGTLAAAGSPGIALIQKTTTATDERSIWPAPTVTSGHVGQDEPTLQATTQPIEASEQAKDTANRLTDATATPTFLARSHADRGQLREALEWAARALAADKLNPANHYLNASILLALGEKAAATTSLQRAIFLDPDFTLAHFTLGMLARLEGRRARAQRYFDNVLSIIAEMDPHQVLAESDGMTARGLGEIIKSLPAIQDVSRKSGMKT